MKITLATVNCRFSHSSLALFYVRNELERHLPASRVTIEQFVLADPYYPTLQRLAAAEPEALLFSVSVWNSGVIGRLAVDLARLLPGVPIVLGGPQAPTLRPLLPVAATVVHGPVEGLVPAFYEDLGRGELKADYYAGPAAAYGMPYRADDFTGPLANRHVYYEASRGCPFACSYCLSAVERGVRAKPLEEVRQELGAILAHRPKVVRFVDRTFNADTDRTLALWQFLIDQPGDTLFHFEIAPDRFSEAMHAFLATVPASRFQFEIGVQSTNPETLAAINRSAAPARIADNTVRLASLDTIHLHLDLILGLPCETAATFARSFNEVFALSPHYIQMGLLKVLPGTPISRQVDEFGMVHCHEPPYEVLATRWLDRRELRDLYWFGECVEAFYNNRYFRTLWAYLRSIKADAAGFFRELLAHCRENGFFEKAKTQELLAGMLAALAVSRPDGELLLELLRYDWLRCGHRFLPPALAGPELSSLRRMLRRTLPLTLPPLYSRLDREAFFKQSVFLPASADLCRLAGIDDGSGDDGIVCLLPERLGGVHRFQRAVRLPL